MAVIVIVGLARSGKDTAADYIAKKYGYARYTFSSVLKEMLEQKGEEPTKGKMLELGDSLRREMGMAAIAKLLDRKIRERGNILLVGPRSMEEVDYFREKFPSLKIMQVTAKKERRFSRKSKMDPKERESFFMRDEKDLEAKGLQEVLDSAEAEIENNSTRKKLYRNIDELMGKIRG